MSTQLSAGEEEARGDQAVETGSYADAQMWFELAAEHWQQADDPVGAGRALGKCGDVCRKRRDLAGARAHHEAAVQVLEGVNAGREASGVAASCLEGLGDDLVDSGELETAKAIFERADAAYRLVGHQSGIGRCQLRLADLNRLAGDLEAAQAFYRHALHVFQRTGDNKRRIETLLGLAFAELAAEDSGAAGEHAEQALGAIPTLAEDRDRLEALARFAVGQVAVAEGDFAGAVQIFREAAAAADEAGLDDLADEIASAQSDAEGARG